MRSIFVNYRRSDSEGEAGRLFDDLATHFGPECVFMDVAAIEPGRDFRKAIDHSLANCSVLLAVIGQQWLESRDASGQRRLDQPYDFVRIELASALQRDIPVVPVLIRGAKMPLPEQLPEDVKELAYRNSVELTHARWKSDVQAMMHSLRHYMEEPCAEPLIGSRKDSSAPFEKHADPRLSSPERALAIEPQRIEHLVRQLAVYIGPVAEVVVKRAARRCASAEELCDAVAREIDTDEDRVKFLRSCRS